MGMRALHFLLHALFLLQGSATRQRSIRVSHAPLSKLLWRLRGGKGAYGAKIKNCPRMKKYMYETSGDFYIDVETGKYVYEVEEAKRQKSWEDRAEEREKETELALAGIELYNHFKAIEHNKKMMKFKDEEKEAEKDLGSLVSSVMRAQKRPSTSPDEQFRKTSRVDVNIPKELFEDTATTSEQSEEVQDTSLKTGSTEENRSEKFKLVPNSSEG
mmetsp:Transcript_38550/g.74083  ORF Transcript_38550/g.74083 Transcript_38550/m.74083 type:complete len:215 (-) Transcript_38550:188-832(-)